MENMKLYNAVRCVPDSAKKAIAAGRLKGKTDINPMWRIKALTEQFGPCGFGWKYVITKQWTEIGASGEISAFCNIDLYIKSGNEWSDPIPGTGGSAFVANERNGLYTSDECYKMALTDAISVACKALGFGADVYWDSDRSKYDQSQKGKEQKLKADEPREYIPMEYVCSDCGKPFEGFTDSKGRQWNAGQVYHMSEKRNADGKARCSDCRKKLEAGAQNG